MGRGSSKTKVVKSLLTRKSSFSGIKLANKSGTLGKQLFQGGIPEEKKFNRVRNYSHVKPIIGGLWTSTETSPGVSEFSEWIDVEYEGGWKSGYRIWELNVSPEARLYQIDLKEDLEYLQELYPVEESNEYKRFAKVLSKEQLKPMRFSLPLFDYEAFYEDNRYDGFQVTTEAIHGEEFRTDGFLSTFVGWDRESTFWVRWVFDGCEEVK